MNSDAIPHNYPVWSVGYIVYLIISFILFTAFIVIYKKCNLKRYSSVILKVFAGLTMANLIYNRISLVYLSLVVYKEGGTWFCLLPSTLCAILSLTVAISLFINSKKINNITRCLLIMSLITTFIYFVWPDALSYTPFLHYWDIACVSMHMSLFLTVIFAFISGKLKVSVHKWYYVPIIYATFICYGLICDQLIKPPFDLQYMNINHPLMSSLPILSSWYLLIVWLLIVYLLITIGYELIHDHKKFKIIIKELIK